MDGLLDKLLEADQPAMNKDMDLDIFEGLYDILQAPLDAPSVSELTVPGWGLPVQLSAPHQQVTTEVQEDYTRPRSPAQPASLAELRRMRYRTYVSCLVLLVLLTAAPAPIFTLLKVCPNRCS